MRYGEPPYTDGDGMRAVIEALDRIEDGIGQRHAENTSSIEVLQKEMKVVIERIDDIAAGFPDNDPGSHRRAHEAYTLKLQERAALYRALREELVKKGLWALIIAVGGLLWLGFSTRFHLGGK